MSKSRRSRNKQSTSPTPSADKPSKSLTTLPPADDPGWTEAGEYHQDFMEGQPNHDKQCEQQIRECFERIEK